MYSKLFLQQKLLSTCKNSLYGPSPYIILCQVYLAHIANECVDATIIHQTIFLNCVLYFKVTISSVYLTMDQKSVFQLTVQFFFFF